MDEITLADDLRSTSHRMVRRLHSTATPGEVPALHRDVLAVLDLEDGLTSADLARRFDVTPQAANQAVSALVAQGLVRRAPDSQDGRRRQLSLTAPGRTATSQLRTTKDSWLAERLRHALSEDERATLREAVTILNRLVEDH